MQTKSLYIVSIAGVVTLFSNFVSNSDDGPGVQSRVEDEAAQFGDIVQGNFDESYRHLAYKHIMGLKWAATYCNSPR